jgi:hypothetical protein
MDSYGLGHGRAAGFCEHDNKIEIAIKDEELVDQLSNY